MIFCHECHTPLEDAAAACPHCQAVRPAAGWPSDPWIGRLVIGNQYRVLRRLGGGGFGSVYLVETAIGGLRRALKILRPEWTSDVRMRERFVNEAVVLEQVNHPGVARCFAVGTLEDGDRQALYLLLEYVPGEPVSALLGPGRTGRRTALTPVQAVRIARHVASGLALAHARGVLHRDIKPENVLVVDPGGAGEQVKLVDFGIARALESEVTTTRTLLGTPAYLAPEQLRQDAVDARLDLFQLGVTLYVMLTGEFPYAGGDGPLPDLPALYETHRDAGPLPSRVNPALAAWPALDRLVSQLVAADRDRRPRTAVQVCEELTRIEHGMAPGTGSSGPLALLEALCATPGESAWWALCRFLMTQEREGERLVATADALLRGWPDDLRQAPQAWWDAARRGDEAPLWPLARALDLSGRCLGDADVVALAGNPAMRTITWLSLADNQIGNDGASAIAASPHLEGLVVLDLSRNRITSQGVEALASGRLRALRSLAIAANGLGPRGAEALASGGLTLHVLDLSENSIGAAGAAVLASGRALATLERLALRDNGLGSDGMGALAVSRTLTNLSELDVSHNAIGPGGAAALALSSAFAGLRRLSLAANTLGTRGVELLLASSRFGALEWLDLSSNDLGAQGAMVLASSPFARRLKGLDAGDNGLGDAGLAAMLGAAHLSGLRTLGLAQNALTAGGAMLLSAAPPELEELDLSNNPLGAAGAASLAEALQRLRIRTLRVAGCGLGAAGLARIVAAGGERLVSLDAAACGIGAGEGLPALGAQALERLDLSRSGIAAEVLVEWIGAGGFGGLRDLRLDSNGIGPDGAGRLAAALSRLPSLEHLSLRDNGLGPDAVEALACSPVARRLLSLDLSSNLLRDAGAEALRRGSGWPLLRSLGLERNDISLAAAISVLSSTDCSLLHRVNLSHNALAGQVDVHSLRGRTVDLLESSFEQVTADGAGFAERFYAGLFARYPGVKPLFAHASMKRQQQHLLSTLSIVIENLRNPDAAAEHLDALGDRHVEYGVSPSHYQAVTGLLIETMRATLGDAWTPELDDAWHEGLEAVSSAMLNAHRRRRAQKAAG